MHKENILVQGIGSIGGILSASLILKGYKVTLITGNEEITKAIKSDGIQIITKTDKLSFHADVFTNLDELPKGQYDISLLIMKANNVVEIAKNTIPYLTSKGYLVTMQNGIVEDAVIKGVENPKRVIGCNVVFSATMHAPGIYERTSPGDIYIGEMDETITPRIKRLGEILNDINPTHITQNIRGILWSKLATNATINSMGVLTGQKFGDMMKRKETRFVTLQTYAEVIDVALENNIKLEKTTADPYLLYMPKNSGWFTRFKKDVIVRLVGRKYKNTKSSSLQSILRGRPTEVDFLNGYVVSKGKLTDTPLNKALIRMIKEIESGKREIKPSNIDDLIQYIIE
jgi:2-dehydropantoate 2-reductase